MQVCIYFRKQTKVQNVVLQHGIQLFENLCFHVKTTTEFLDHMVLKLCISEFVGNVC